MSFRRSKFKEIRELRGLTQEEVARLSGLSQGYVSQLDRGEFPNVGTAVTVAQILGCAVEEVWIVGGEE